MVIGAVSVPYQLPNGVVVAAAGSVMYGGIVLGLLDSRGRWATETAVPPTALWTHVNAPTDGDDRIVLANNLPDTRTTNDAGVTIVGPVGFNPAALGVVAAAVDKTKAAEPKAAPEYQIAITPLDNEAWETVRSPARLEGKRLKIKGIPSVPAAYAAVSTLYRLPKGATIAAAGTVTKGGIVLGLQDSGGQWATVAAIPPGVFRTTVQVPAGGEYRIVIANNLPDAHTANDVEVTEVGLVGLDPAALRVVAVPSKVDLAEVTPLDDGAWETVTPPAHLEGKGLRIEGTPSSPAAYAAVSASYRLPKGAVVVAAGAVMQGEILLGLLDSHGQWATEAAILPGVFRKTVQVPAEGEYRIVIANNLPDAHAANDAEVTEVGLVGLDPAALRVGAPRRTEGPTHP
jgi:hypothetical protein